MAPKGNLSPVSYVYRMIRTNVLIAKDETACSLIYEDDTDHNRAQ
jgi:hypothetical protein